MYHLMQHALTCKRSSAGYSTCYKI